MAQGFLSNIELFYVSPDSVIEDEIIIDGDEYKHLVNVMRHKEGDEVFVTNGLGRIFNVSLNTIGKNKAIAEILEVMMYHNDFKNLYFCIPLLKSSDRFEFALEKCIELGITNFIIYEAERSIKKGSKQDRWNKIALAAMKQSLRSHVPKLEFKKNISEIKNLEGDKIIFDQTSKIPFSDFLKGNLKETIFLPQRNYYFVFGPEGGNSEEELKVLEGSIKYKLTSNRLRSETAIITAASLITTIQ